MPDLRVVWFAERWPLVGDASLVFFLKDMMENEVNKCKLSRAKDSQTCLAGYGVYVVSGVGFGTSAGNSNHDLWSGTSAGYCVRPWRV